MRTRPCSRPGLPWTLPARPGRVVRCSYAGSGRFVASLVGGSPSSLAAGFAKHRHDELSDVLAESIPRPAGIAVFLVALAAGLRFLPLGTLASPRLTASSPSRSACSAWRCSCASRFAPSTPTDAPTPSSSRRPASARPSRWVVGLAVAAVLVSDALGVSLAPALTALGVGSLAVALALAGHALELLLRRLPRRRQAGPPGGLHPRRPDLRRLRRVHRLALDAPSHAGEQPRHHPQRHALQVDHHELQPPHDRTSPPACASTSRSTPTSTRSRTRSPTRRKRALDLPGMAEAPAPSVADGPRVRRRSGRLHRLVLRAVVRRSERVQHALRKRIAARFKKDGWPSTTARGSAQARGREKRSLWTRRRTLRSGQMPRQGRAAARRHRGRAASAA